MALDRYHVMYYIYTCIQTVKPMLLYSNHVESYNYYVHLLYMSQNRTVACRNDCRLFETMVVEHLKPRAHMS
jgi:hypothetical protein